MFRMKLRFAKNPPLLLLFATNNLRVGMRCQIKRCNNAKGEPQIKIPPTKRWQSANNLFFVRYFMQIRPNWRVFLRHIATWVGKSSARLLSARDCNWGKKYTAKVCVKLSWLRWCKRLLLHA